MQFYTWRFLRSTWGTTLESLGGSVALLTDKQVTLWNSPRSETGLARQNFLLGSSSNLMPTEWVIHWSRPAFLKRKGRRTVESNNLAWLNKSKSMLHQSSKDGYCAWSNRYYSYNLFCNIFSRCRSDTVVPLQQELAAPFICYIVIVFIRISWNDLTFPP